MDLTQEETEDEGDFSEEEGQEVEEEVDLSQNNDALDGCNVKTYSFKDKHRFA